MSEVPSSHLFEALLGKYTTAKPNFWAINFVESVRMEEAETNNDVPEYRPSPDFGYSIFKEAGELILDTMMPLSPDKSAETVRSLKDRERIVPLDEVDFYAVTKLEYTDLIEAIKQSSADKLIALTHYLIHKGDLHAVPLAFAVGMTSGIFTDRFEHFGEEEWTSIKPYFEPDGKYYRNSDEDRGQVMRKAKKLYANGGRIFFPYFIKDKVLQAVVEPDSGNEPAKIALGTIPQHLEARLITWGSVNDERQILAILHPKEITVEDDE